MMITLTIRPQEQSSPRFNSQGPATAKLQRRLEASVSWMLNDEVLLEMSNCPSANSFSKGNGRSGSIFVNRRGTENRGRLRGAINTQRVTQWGPHRGTPTGTQRGPLRGTQPGNQIGNQTGTQRGNRNNTQSGSRTGDMRAPGTNLSPSNTSLSKDNLGNGQPSELVTSDLQSRCCPDLLFLPFQDREFTDRSC